MTPPVLSFVIPVRNEADRLRVTLQSVCRAAGSARVEIVVVDNGSSDGSADIARTFGATVLERPGVPVSALRNAGARAVSGDVLAFVDADNEIAAGWVAAARDILRDERVGAAGAPYSAPRGANWVQRTYDRLRRQPAGQAAVEWLGSGNLVVPRRVFASVGGFDERLVTCEDVDLCARIRALGLRLVSDSRLQNIHHGDPSTLVAVFRGELWRGRDNLRVSLRSPRSWRSMASLGVSGMALAGLGLLPAALFSGAYGPLVAAAGLALAGGVILIRSVRLLPGGIATPVSTAHAVAVAAAYETGRALALVVRLQHRRRHEPGTSSHA